VQPFFITLALLLALPVAAEASPAPTIQAPSPCPPDWEPQICLLKEMVERIKRDNYHPVDIPAFLNEGLRRTIGALPHSVYYDQKAYAEMWQDVRTGGTYAGLGVVVEDLGDTLKVVLPMEDSAAEKAGIQAGDLIAEADGQSLARLSFADKIALLRGPLGSKVVVVLLRGPRMKRLALSVTRATVKSNPLRAHMLSKGVGYVRVGAFTETLVGDLAAVLKGWQAQVPPPTGLVLDLRHNGGGVLESGIGVAAAFLPAGAVVVNVAERSGRSQQVRRARFDQYRTGANADGKDPLEGLAPLWKSLPIVALTHAHTVSSAELVAGALQDHGRAVVMGQPSYGKGSVQVTTNQTGGTGLRIVTAHYFTPSGCVVDARGVRPDWVVSDRAEGDPDQTLLLREVDRAPLPFEPNSRNPEQEQERLVRLAQRNALQRQMEDKKQDLPAPVNASRFGKPGDFMLAQAEALLQGRPVMAQRKMPAKPTPHQPCAGAAGWRGPG